jgi:phage protein D
MDGNYQAQLKLKIDGKEASPALIEDILQAFVEESLHQPGMFTLVIRNDYQSGIVREQPWKYRDLFKIGKSVEIGFVSTTTYSPEWERAEDSLLVGEITAIETHFTERTQAPVIVRGYDASHRLFRGRYSRSFLNMTDTDIVRKVIAEVGIKPGAIEASGAPHDYVFQANQTNMEFLRSRATRIGFELFVQDGKLNFRKPKPDSNSLQMEWLKEIQSFRVRLTSAEQVKEVEVRGWDYSTKRPILAKAQADRTLTDTQNGRGSSTSSAFNGQPANPKMIVVDQPVFQAKEADVMAQALCDELGGQFVYADAKSEGNPEIRPGRIADLKDLGSHSGKYYITETRHVYVERVYTTEFCVRGMQSGNLMATLAPATRPSPGQTFLVGIVTDNEDPQGWGRVKVKFPTLTEDHSSNWARIVAPGAGAGRGVYWLPEIDDEVLVAFEHGDVHRPYVIGGVWNGVDATPRSIGDTVVGGNVRLRAAHTRKGHKAWFVDEDKGSEKKGYYIQTGTGSGHWLRFNDTERFIEVETIGGHIIRLSDLDRSISITSTGRINQTATASVSTQAASVGTTASASVSTQAPTITTTAAGALNQSAGGAATLSAGATINIQAGGAVTVTGSVVTITGATILLNGIVTVNGKPLPL